MTINKVQVRAARVLAGWTQADLAKAAGVSLMTIKAIETRGTGKSSVEIVSAIQTALESAGVEFIPQNGGGAGVRYRDRE